MQRSPQPAQADVTLADCWTQATASVLVRMKRLPVAAGMTMTDPHVYQHVRGHRLPG
jgi:hypothetical protein